MMLAAKSGLPHCKRWTHEWRHVRERESLVLGELFILKVFLF